MTSRKLRRFARRHRRRFARAIVVTAAVAVAMVAAPAGAFGHVAIDQATPNPDGTATITLSWKHGCAGGAATTGIDITAGQGVEIIAAGSAIPGWNADVGPGSVRFAGPAVPTHETGTVIVTARVTGSPGESVQLPAIQRCGDQQVAWTDPDAAAEYPAPTMIATAAIISPPSTPPSCVQRRRPDPGVHRDPAARRCSRRGRRRGRASRAPWVTSGAEVAARRRPASHQRSGGSATRTSQRTPGAVERRWSAVTRGQSRISAAAI